MLKGYSNGKELAVEGPAKSGRGKLVCLNFYPVSLKNCHFGYLVGFDAAKLMGNALFYASKSCKNYSDFV
jgi:hypothetical protein